MFNPIRLVLITLISLFIFSCDEDDNPVFGSNEIDVDWVLVKTPNMESPNDIGIGYFFFFTNINTPPCHILFRGGFNF